MMLVGDIGGTHARLSLLAPPGRTIRSEARESRKYPSLEVAVRTFLTSGGTKAPKVSSAAFGIAGPVAAGRVTTTTLPWVVDARQLSRKLGIKHVTLLNDLVALALGSLEVRRSKLHVLGDAG